MCGPNYDVAPASCIYSHSTGNRHVRSVLCRTWAHYPTSGKFAHYHIAPSRTYCNVIRLVGIKFCIFCRAFISIFSNLVTRKLSHKCKCHIIESAIACCTGSCKIDMITFRATSDIKLFGVTIFCFCIILLIFRMNVWCYHLIIYHPWANFNTEL